MKQRIRLTESNLNKLIKESVKQAINEISDENKAYNAGKAWEAGGGDNPLRRFGHSILHPFKHRKYNRQAKKFGKSAVMDKPTQTMYTASGHTVSYRPDYNEKTGRFDINRNNSFKDERFVSSKIKKGHVPNTNSSLLSPDIDANELDGPVQYLNTYFNLGKGSVKAKQNESKLNRIIKETVQRVLRESNEWEPEEFVDYEEYVPYGISGDAREKNMMRSDKLGIPMDQRCPFCDKPLKDGNYVIMKHSTDDDNGVSKYYYHPTSPGKPIRVGKGCFKNLSKAYKSKYNK